MVTAARHRGARSGRRLRLARLLDVLGLLGVLGVLGGGLLGPARAFGAGSLVVAPVAGTGTAGPVLPGPALSSPLTGPGQVALGPDGDLYIADPGENRVLRVSGETGTISVLAGTGAAGVPVPGPAVTSPVRAPAGVAVDGAGDVLIADTGNHLVERVAPDGTLSIIAGTGAAGAAVAGPALSSPLGSPKGVAVDPTGDVLIADAGGSPGKPAVERVAPDGTLSIIAGNGTTAQPVAGPATSSPLRAPSAVATDGAGDVFVADSPANVVLKITPDGTLSVVAGRSNGAYGSPTAGPATGSRLAHPGGLALDPAGDLFIADTANNRVEQVTPGGTLSVLGGTGHTGAAVAGAPATATPLSGPDGVIVAANGTLDVALSSAFALDRLQPAPPAATSAPTLSGSARVGQTLSASAGSWTGTVSSESEVWEDCSTSGSACVTIPGAAGTSYELGAGDVGHTIRVIATVTGPWGSASATSSPSPVVSPLAPAVQVAPQITGTPTDRETLHVSAGTWSGSPSSITLQWQRCGADGTACTNLGGAASSSYTLSESDVATTLRVLVTATNAGGRTVADTALTPVIAPATVAWANVTPPAEVSRPVITGYAGGAVVGQTLACSTGTWTGSPDAFTYIWSRDSQPIAGATSRTYTISPSDRGYTLVCTVVASNAGGAIEADSFGVGVPGPRAGVPPLPTPPRTSTSAGPARAAGVTRSSTGRRRVHRRGRRGRRRRRGRQRQRARRHGRRHGRRRARGRHRRHG